jgi:hypothetical protein
MAYEMNLCNVDADGGQNLEVGEWVEREEIRRAWWLVWEFDTFAGRILRRPYTIDRKRMSVLLPASDDAWFGETPVDSAKLELRPAAVWKSFQGCGNQDYRAWFIAANFLMSLIYDFLRSKDEQTAAAEKQELINAVSNFKLALPSSFRLETAHLSFNPQSFAKGNWVVATHLMMLASTMLISGTRPARPYPPGLKLPITPSFAALSQYRATELVRIVNQWSPNYIHLSHPFTACIVIPVYVEGLPMPLAASAFWATQDMSKLVLNQYASVWELGSVLLSKSD